MVVWCVIGLASPGEEGAPPGGGAAAPLGVEAVVYRGHAFRVVGGAASALPPEGEAIRYRVLVEEGLEGYAAEFAGEVERVLGDPAGWARGGVPLVRVEGGEDISVLLAKPRTVDNLCAPMNTGGKLSCALQRQANINLQRFLEGAPTWGEEVRGYRGYLINHEVGHLLGMGHAGCPSPGAPAPVMMQQTIRLGRCLPSPSPGESEVEAMAKRRKAREARWEKVKVAEARWRKRQGSGPRVDPQ